MAALTERGQAQPTTLAAWKRRQNLMSINAGGLVKNLSPDSIIYQLEDSTEANLAGVHRIFLSVMKSPLAVTHSSLERAVRAHWDGWALGHRENLWRVGFTLVLRINQASHGNSTEDGQSVFLRIPSPQILESQQISAFRISQVKTEPTLDVSG